MKLCAMHNVALLLAVCTFEFSWRCSAEVASAKTSQNWLRKKRHTWDETERNTDDQSLASVRKDQNEDDEAVQEEVEEDMSQEEKAIEIDESEKASGEDNDAEEDKENAETADESEEGSSSKGEDKEKEGSDEKEEAGEKDDNKETEEEEGENEDKNETEMASAEDEEEGTEKTEAEEETKVETVYEQETTPQPPPKMPFQELFDNADAVARDAELRRGADFWPEGAHEDVDVKAKHLNEANEIFSQEPNIYKNCMLIRDYAQPLRVGSSIITERSILHGSAVKKSHKHGFLHRVSGRVHQNMTRKIHAAHSASFARFHRRKVRGADEERGDTKTLPDALLVPKGGVVDIDMSVESEAGKIVDDGAQLQVNMFAFLQSIAGEVAVVPNGGIGKWSSKKRVPLAGYLCPGPDGPVLHTLETPCLPTAVGDDGLPFPPPPSRGDADVAGEEEEEEDNEGSEEERETDIDMQPAGAPAPAMAHMRQVPPGLRPPGPPPRVGPYHVWVGNEKLTFSSKPKADRFCKRLTEHIAKDLGDTEWSVDGLPDEVRGKKDPTVSSFMQFTRKASESWTLGTKRLLVVVMDWMVGDKSKAPFSEQKLKPAHYEERIFPRVQKAFREMSYGKFNLEVTFVPEVIRYLRPRSRYSAQGYPFPGLYNGAQESLEGNAKFGQLYSFDNYDLVYVINPQQAPTGTKGVAWVGAKGAICNGCEEISDNFQVMVAVHELGHNLGLWHASSSSLEYGNVFDWMGNYPDVEGLSYGVGYKLKLKWLPPSSVAAITDSTLSDLNDEYFLRPFDTTKEPRDGQLVGIQIQLKDNSRDLYISYRKTAGIRKGIYLTWQDKDKPNSELIDAACHSPSQQDARLRPGWTFMDPSNQVVVFVASVDEHLATVRIFRVPETKVVPSIRARATFTDGVWKCPRTCTDSDLLVSMYNGCPMLKQDGYCRNGAITMGGTKYSIGKDLCPSSCGFCTEVIEGSTLKSGGCDDRNIRISGMSCQQVTVKGYCDYETNMGHIGNDLCRKSCGKCPPSFTDVSTAGSFHNPTPKRTHGSKSSATPSASDIDVEQPGEENQEDKDAGNEAADKEEEETKDEEEEEEEKEVEEEAEDEEQDEKEAKKEDEDELCTDDTVWSDADGDGCKVYASYVKLGKLTRTEACGYNGGQAQIYCRRTCDTCKPMESTCEDKECITSWKEKYGKCYTCPDWPAFCHLRFFKADCPRTCGVCKAENPLTTPPLPMINEMPTTTTTTTTTTTSYTAPPPCEDAQCVNPWLQDTGKCFQCKDFAEEFCGRDEGFMASCPRSCRMCIPHEDEQCHDDFKPHTCRRYVRWQWCGLSHIAEHCKASCGICQAQYAAVKRQSGDTAEQRHSKGMAASFKFGYLSLCSALFVTLTNTWTS